MIIDISDFQQQWKNRHHNKTLLMNCRIGEEIYSHTLLYDVYIEGTKIVEVTPTNNRVHPFYIDPDVFKVECRQCFVIPGLCDAHTHVTAHTADLPSLNSTPESLTIAKASNILRSMLLRRGFTTVRDCGGADFGLAQAIEEGEILGPRLLFTGHALSQTGGHGDMRTRGEKCFSCGAALRGIGRVCDGDAEVRKAARDELRKGAHCIKVMASGGVSSPTDRLTNTQFSLQEIRAIVEEAKAAGTYVCAHAYTTEAISRAVICGVRSIEHGNYLDDSTAALMAEHGAFLVPTIITYAALKESGNEAGMKPEMIEKIDDLVEAGMNSLKRAKRHNVPVCFGSDLLGMLHDKQSEQLLLLQKVFPAKETLAIATRRTAELFNMETSIGRVESGYTADLLVLDCKHNPYRSTKCLLDEDNLWVIIKEGVIVKLDENNIVYSVPDMSVSLLQ